MSGPSTTEHGIGLVPCIAFAVGTMIGGGVFTLSGTAVDRSGPAAILAYLLAGAIMLLCALSFVVVSSRASSGRSGYDPIGDLLGPGWRFLAMWGFWLNAATAIAFVLVSFGTYLQAYFLEDVSITTAAIVALVVIGLLNVGPADLVGKAETALVVIKVAVLLVLIGVGLAALEPGDLSPFAPRGGSTFLGTTALLFTAYTGFNVVTNMAGSVRDPARTVPRAIILSLVIAAVIYVGVILALLASGLDHFGADGLGAAAEVLMGHAGALLVAFAACVSTLSSANANVLGSSELVIRMTGAGDVPPALGRTTRRGHAFVSVALVALVAAVLVLVGGTDAIIALSNVVAVFAMVIVCVAAARIARAGWGESGMRLPGGVTIPVAGAIAAAAQLPSLGWGNVAVGAVLMLAGLGMFLQRHRQQYGERVHERVAELVEALETPVARALRRSVRPSRLTIPVDEA